jgi:Protein kinase domain/PQQ-like domain
VKEEGGGALAGPSRAPPARSDVVLLASVDGSLRALSAGSGRMLWQLKTGRPLVSSHSAAEADGKVESSSESSGTNGDSNEENNASAGYGERLLRSLEQAQRLGQRASWTKQNFSNSEEGQRGNSDSDSDSDSDARGPTEVAIVPSVWGSATSARASPDRDNTDIPVYFVESSGGRLSAVQRLPMGLREMVASSPVRAGPLLLVGSKSSSVMVIDSATGAVRRSMDHLVGHMDGTGSFRPDDHNAEGGFFETCQEGSLMVGRTDYVVRAFDSLTGKEQWNISAGEFTPLDSRGPESDAHNDEPSSLRALLDPTDGSVHVADLATGERLWSDHPGERDQSADSRVVAALDMASYENILSFGEPSSLALIRNQGAAGPGEDRSRAAQALRRLLPTSMRDFLESDFNLGGMARVFGAATRSRISDGAVLIDSVASSHSAGLFAMELPRWLEQDPRMLKAAHEALTSRHLERLAIGSGQEKDQQCNGQSCMVGIHTVDPSTNTGNSPQRDPLLLSDRPFNENLGPDTWVWLGSMSDAMFRYWPVMMLEDQLIWLGFVLVLVLSLLVVFRRRFASALTAAPEPMPSAQPKRRRNKNKAKRKAQRTNKPNPVPPRIEELPDDETTEPPAEVEQSDPKDESVPSEPQKTVSEEPAFDEETGELRIGRLVIHTRTVLGYGSSGNMVFEGLLDGTRRVAVKRMLRAFVDVAEREIATLSQCDEHPYVVTYFGCEKDREFVYLSLTHCPHSLETYMSDLASAGTNRNATAQRLAHQICKGLQHLHSLNIAHRDLKVSLFVPLHLSGVMPSPLG